MSEVVKTNKPPFAARAQRINIYLLLVALLMLAQQFTYTIYLWGFRLLFVVVTLQVALGNINPDWNSKKTLKKTLVILLRSAELDQIRCDKYGKHENYYDHQENYQSLL